MASSDKPWPMQGSVICHQNQNQWKEKVHWRRRKRSRRGIFYSINHFSRQVLTTYEAVGFDVVWLVLPPRLAHQSNPPPKRKVLCICDIPSFLCEWFTRVATKRSDVQYLRRSFSTDLFILQMQGWRDEVPFEIFPEKFLVDRDTINSSIIYPPRYIYVSAIIRPSRNLVVIVVRLHHAFNHVI